METGNGMEWRQTVEWNGDRQWNGMEPMIRLLYDEPCPCRTAFHARLYYKKTGKRVSHLVFSVNSRDSPSLVGALPSC